MAITLQMRTEVAQLYVALFGRAPDGEGLSFWTQLRGQGKTMAEVADVMFATAPARVYYPGYFTNPEIITSFYVNVLGRQPDAEGKTFWTAKLDAPGATFGSVISEMIYTVQNYSGTNVDSKNSHDLFVNRVAVAQYYGEHNGGIAGSTQVLAVVTKDPATVTASKTAIDNGTAPGINQGQTFVLTAVQDAGTTFTGGAGNDTFQAPIGQNAAGDLLATLQDFDTLDGGAGSDTLEATLYGGATVTPELRGIETLKLHFTSPGDTIDLQHSQGIDKVVFGSSTASPAVVKNASTVSTIRLEGGVNQVDALMGVAPAAGTLNLDYDHVVSGRIDFQGAIKASTVNVNLTDSTAVLSSAQNDTYTVENITATGKNTWQTAGTGQALATLNVSGSGSRSLANIYTGIKTLDASKLQGDLQVTFDGALARSITAGSGNDLVFLSTTVAAGTTVSLGDGDDVLKAYLAAGNISAADGGAGYDTLSVLGNSNFTAAQAAKFTGFEALDIGGGQGIYDIGLFGLGTVQLSQKVFDGPLAADVTVKNAPDALTLKFVTKSGGATPYLLQGQAVTIQGKDYGGTTAGGDAEALTIATEFNDGNKNSTADPYIKAPTLVANGVETIVFDQQLKLADGGTGAVNPADYVLQVDLSGDSIEKIAIKGDGTVNLRGGNVTQIGRLALVDASASNGAVAIDLSNQANAVTFVGGAGADAYTAAKGGGTIFGGKGGDVITLEAAKTAAELLVLKSAAESKLTPDAAGKATLAAAGSALDSVSNFLVSNGAAGDRLDVTSFGFAGAQTGVVDVTGKIGAGGANLASVQAFFNSVAGNRGVAYAVVGTDTFVFVDANKDGNFTAADDAVLKLVGITTFSTDALVF
jgi:hypothetical protein